MIVKDEAAWIEQCLSSVKDLVDEIIIVDTGCTDNTVELAKNFGRTAQNGNDIVAKYRVGCGVYSYRLLFKRKRQNRYQQT